MKKIILMILIIAIVLSAGCVKTPKNITPEIIGEVQEINEAGSAILVDSTADKVKGLVWLSITDKTTFKDGVSTVFNVGNHVEIATDGAIAESYPMQASAAVVYVNREK